MNNDLISREQLKDAFDNLCCHNCKICRNFRIEDSFYKCKLIENAPTVEAFTKDDMAGAYNGGYACGSREAKRPQSEWIDEGQYAEGHSEHAYFCKKCGYHIIELPNMISENQFCKNCGAKMKGGAE